MEYSRDKIVFLNGSLPASRIKRSLSRQSMKPSRQTLARRVKAMKRGVVRMHAHATAAPVRQRNTYNQSRQAQIRYLTLLPGTSNLKNGLVYHNSSVRIDFTPRRSRLGCEVRFLQGNLIDFTPRSSRSGRKVNFYREAIVTPPLLKPRLLQ